MSKYRNRLPQLKDRLFLTDGGLETTLIYHDSMNLPHFAAFDLLKDDAGTEILRRYFKRYTELARLKGVGTKWKVQRRNNRDGRSRPTPRAADNGANGRCSKSAGKTHALRRSSSWHSARAATAIAPTRA
jgi:hypothetical protein